MNIQVKNWIQIRTNQRSDERNGCNAHVLSSLDDIAWLLNIRGNDIAYCPLVLSYAIVYNNSVELFADIRKFSDDIINLLAENQVKIYPYEDIYRKVSEMTSEDKLLWILQS